MIDDERTELRRDRIPVEEATRAVDRSLDLRRPAADDAALAAPEAPVATAAAGRVARVPGTTADDAAYGIRRSASSAPVTRSTAAEPAIRRREAAPRRARTGLALVIAVAAFALVLAAAAVVLVLLVVS
ncbi:hypothetical protein [Microbacterium sp. T2.11-28]|uniref:hypothetical protein n=1 Tax=Microbacterium sp. T2.11-28 TaxID=3041169 RepID=UPI0025411DDA|nr:hypothetical protein [Microbacterium sp. T2.11-28]